MSTSPDEPVGLRVQASRSGRTMLSDVPQAKRIILKCAIRLADVGAKRRSKTCMQLGWLKCIGADVDVGSLTGAVPAVNRCHCAGSMQFRKLENAMRRPLLVCGPRHHQLTPDGQQLWHGGYPRCMPNPGGLSRRVDGWANSPGMPDDYATKHLTTELSVRAAAWCCRD